MLEESLGLFYQRLSWQTAQVEGSECMVGCVRWCELNLPLTMKSHSAAPPEGALGRLPRCSPSSRIKLAYLRQRHLRSPCTLKCGKCFRGSALGVLSL